MYNIMNFLDPCSVIEQSIKELKLLFGENSTIIIYLYNEITDSFFAGCEKPTIEIPRGLGLFYDAFRYKKEICKNGSMYLPFTSNRGETLGVIQVKREKKLTLREKNIFREGTKIIASLYQNAEVHLAMRETFETFVDTLSAAIDARDFVTSGHSKRTALYALELCHALNLDTVICEKIKYASLLHDIGKIGISEKLLQKSGHLDETQFLEIKKHTLIGKQILEKTKLPKEFKDIPNIVFSHHERIDGSGYPCSLKGNEIPYESRVLAICDVFDALTSHRQYRGEMNFEEALQLMKGETGQFDPEILEVFTQIPLKKLKEIHSSYRI